MSPLPHAQRKVTINSFLPGLWIIIFLNMIAIRSAWPEINEIMIISWKIPGAFFILLTKGRWNVNATYVGVEIKMIKGRHHRCIFGMSTIHSWSKDQKPLAKRQKRCVKRESEEEFLEELTLTQKKQCTPSHTNAVILLTSTHLMQTTLHRYARTVLEMMSWQNNQVHHMLEQPAQCLV